MISKTLNQSVSSIRVNMVPASILELFYKPSDPFCGRGHRRCLHEATLHRKLVPINFHLPTLRDPSISSLSSMSIFIYCLSEWFVPALFPASDSLCGLIA
jgi:hypothetical protein